MPTKREELKPKENSVIKAATKLFLKNGFIRTSMDAIAVTAKVTKQTVYTYYKSKDDLFKLIVELKCDELAPSDEMFGSDQKDIKTSLTNIADKFIAIVTDKETLKMNSLAIAEAERMPKIAKIYYEGGPGKVMSLFEEFLKIKVNAGIFNIKKEEIPFAAGSFFYGILGDYYIQLSLGIIKELSESERKKLIEFSVRNFLKLYLR